jgi:hypothetical protein
MRNQRFTFSSDASDTAWETGKTTPTHMSKVRELLFRMNRITLVIQIKSIHFLVWQRKVWKCQIILSQGI